jgi:asparagine synthase (glutamine-hydrolysing)
MCGIAGFFYSTAQPPTGGEASALLKKMTRELAHRGPDAEGYLEEPGVGLGHRRLKIIDLEGGIQPMTSADGRYTIIFNGEIYNFREIRARLESRGRKFKTRSDTESLLQLFEEKGAACLSELEGMFAFVVWDRQKRVVTAAVDPFGKKPFYYSILSGGSGFVFASEPRGLLAHPAVSREPDRRSIARYLAFEYVPAPDTIWKGMKKLRGGTAIEAGAQGTRVFRYTKPFGPAVFAKTEAGWQAETTELFRDAVKRRLVSDVPLGVFLSGGVDSTAVLAEMRALDPGRKIKTFTIGFEEASFDESAYARRAADFFSTEHIEEKLTLASMLKEHEAILAHLDEPMADASFIPTFLLSRLVRKHVAVALGGDGGDELFGGYPTFDAARFARKIDRWAPWSAGLMQSAANALPVSMDNLSLDFKAKQFTKGLRYPPRIRNQVWLGAFSDLELDAVLSPDLRQEASAAYQGIDETLGEPMADYRDDLQEFYFRFYLEGDILVKTDRASMANSLETRSPLLDDRLVGTVRRIPADIRFKDGKPKELFKKILRGRVPAEIIDRPKKGFGIPISHWIRKDLKPQFESALAPDRIRREGFFNPDTVSLLLAEHLAGKRDNRKQLWTLYTFQKWQETWL